MRIHVAVVVVALAAFGQAALAHGDKAEKKARRPLSVEETSFGREGDPKKVSRTIVIGMSDKMRYSPSELMIQQGETIRFRARNAGQVLHEMVLGTMQELKEHSEMMRKYPGMEHDAPYMAHVSPGKTGSMVWQFTKPGEFYYACLVPGHFEAGMIGKVKVVSN